MAIKMKKPIFLHGCATCFEIPSNLRAMLPTNWHMLLEVAVDVVLLLEVLARAETALIHLHLNQ